MSSGALIVFFEDVSELLYVVLIGLDEFSDADEVLATLTDTRWDTVDQSIAQQQKQRICNILGVECVMPSTGCERSSRPSAVVDELDSYGSLVRDAGNIYVAFPFKMRQFTLSISGY